MVAKTVSHDALDTVAANGEFDVLFGDNQTQAGVSRLIGMSEEQQFRSGYFEAGVIKNLFVVFGVQQP